MNERLKVIDFKYKVLFWTFLLFLVISFLSPITFDDWSSYFIGKKGFKSIIDNVIYMYSNWEGRVVGRFLINLLSFNKLIFNIVFSLLMTGVVYSINTIIGKVDNKYYYLLAPIGLLIIPASTFAQNYAWINGAITFTFPSCLTILYFTYLYKNSKNKYNYKEVFLLSFISIITPMFVENIGIAFAVLNILLLGRKLITKDVNRHYQLLFTALSVLFITLMLASPGSLIRVNDEEVFYSYSIIEKIGLNISSFISYTFVQNIFIMILMLVPINYVIWKKIGYFVYGRLIIVAFNLIPLFSLACNLPMLSPVNLDLLISRYSGIFLVENGYFTIYWFIFISLFIYSIFYILPKSELRRWCIYLIVAAFVSTSSMMFTPIFDNRVTIFYLFTTLLISVLLIKNLNIRISGKFTIFISCVLCLYYLSVMGLNFYLDKSRGEYIAEQINYSSEVILVKANPLKLNYNYNPYDYEQLEMFRKYYGIPKDRRIKVEYLGIFGDIEDFIKNSK